MCGLYDDAPSGAAKLGKSAKEKYIESIQNKLLSEVTIDIQAAFGELKKNQ